MEREPFLQRFASCADPCSPKVASSANGGGTVLAALTSDASGIFCASTPVASGSGVYVSAAGTTGVTRSMTGAITSGACNRCHTSASRLIVD
jgi:hypothetical protein